MKDGLSLWLGGASTLSAAWVLVGWWGPVIAAWSGFAMWVWVGSVIAGEGVKDPMNPLLDRLFEGLVPGPIRRFIERRMGPLDPEKDAS